jgi:Amt family ammonium transporter
LFDACVGAIGFWLVGYTFAFGNVNGGFIGADPNLWAANGFNNVREDHFLNWIFHFSYASTSATIVSGALAERCQLNTYVIFSFIQTSFIFPVVCAWNWGRGWLYVMGFHDFAGSATVHLVGGTAAFWGAWIIGERYGKAKQRDAKKKNEENNILRNSVNFEAGEFQKIMDHVNKDYR